MKESATIAMEYIKANADLLGLSADVFKKYNVHIHVPEGATPKDGPSAGISMCTAVTSVLSQLPVRADGAMTGEIRGRWRRRPRRALRCSTAQAPRPPIRSAKAYTSRASSSDAAPATYRASRESATPMLRFSSPAPELSRIVSVCISEPSRCIAWGALSTATAGLWLLSRRSITSMAGT